MTIREDPNYDPYLEHQDPLPQTPQCSNILGVLPPRPYNQHLNPFPKPPVERFHPYPRPLGHLSGDSHNNGSNDQGHQVTQAESVAMTTNKRAAERFLDEMRTSLGPSLRPKLEPVEASLPSVSICAQVPSFFNFPTLPQPTRNLPLGPKPRPRRSESQVSQGHSEINVKRVIYPLLQLWKPSFNALTQFPRNNPPLLSSGRMETAQSKIIPGQDPT